MNSLYGYAKRDNHTCDDMVMLNSERITLAESSNALGNGVKSSLAAMRRQGTL